MPDLDALIAERDRCLRELDVAGAKRVMNRHDASDEAVLIDLHKGRAIWWEGATDRERAISKTWLTERGYAVPDHVLIRRR